jgi:glutamate/tyrosine decarboxylase-like PLP-dependent enzyme
VSPERALDVITGPVFPIDADRMHKFDPAMTELITDYVRERLAMADTSVDGLGDRQQLEEVMADLIGDGPRPAKEVLDIYVDHLADTILSSDSPRFFAFIPAAPTKAALLFDMVVSAASLQGCSWLEAAGAVIAENQALRVLADVAGLPASAGGVFVSGGSAGNLSALVVARDTARHRRTEAGLPEVRMRVIVSDQAHSSIKSALNIVSMDAIVVPTSDGRMTEENVRSAIAKESEYGDVVAIVATAGTTNAGIIDDLAGVAKVAQEHDWWFHVDGAYGGAGMLSRNLRHRYNGVELADSLVMDPHKWWFAPFDSAALIYRDPRLAKAVHTQNASYLDVIHDDDDDFNPSDLAYHLTRRARGMALWFSLAVNGIDAYRDAVDYSLAMTKYAVEQIRTLQYLELIREPDLSVILFRRSGWALADYESWGHRLLRDQTAFVTHSAWRGETVGRLVFLHPGTTTEMVDDVLATLN